MYNIAAILFHKYVQSTASLANDVRIFFALLMNGAVTVLKVFIGWTCSSVHALWTTTLDDFIRETSKQRWDELSASFSP